MAALVESMFSVKATPWHQQGNVIMEAPDTEGAYELSGLNWKVELVRNFCERNGVRIDAGTFSVIRDKDNTVLGNCGERYVPYQNREAFDWCNPLVESDLWQYETAGSLKGGCICWALLKQGEIELVSADPLKQYLLLTWSHDGSKSVQVMPTTVRVVCNNTLQQALRTAEMCHKIRHTVSMKPRLEEVRKLYSEVKSSFDNQQEAFKILLDKKVTSADIEQYVNEIMKSVFGKTDDMKGKALTISNQIENTLLHYCKNGSGIREQGIGNTMYGAFNGVTEAIEHVIGGNRVKDRGYNILFGNGKANAGKAFDIAMNMAMAV
jgi:phage/plasmid-like protein (TIGR03299 family)